MRAWRASLVMPEFLDQARHGGLVARMGHAACEYAVRAKAMTTTRFSQASKDWELTPNERDFLGRALEQIRAGETAGAGRKAQTLDQIIDCVRNAAYDAEMQYLRTLHVDHQDAMQGLDSAANLLLAMMVNWAKVGPILRGEKQKSWGNR